MVTSELDLRLLQYIELNPTISVRELAKKVKISWITAQRHFKELKNEGILSDPIAVFNPSSIGLDRHLVLFKTQDEQQLEQLEAACDAHPYTHYRTRIYGPFSGLFSQFDVPPKGSNNLERYFASLKDEGVFENLIHHTSLNYRRSTKTNLELFRADTHSWRFEWNAWLKDIDSASEQLPSSDDKRELGDLKLDHCDLEILRDLTANASISGADLEKKYMLSQSMVSRKLIFLKENVIESVRAQIDRSRFNIISTKLFYIPEAPDKNRARLYNAFSAPSAPPFPLSIDLLEEGGVILWGRMPPLFEHGLYYLLWSMLPSLQVFTMETSGGHSRLYWFYPENLDPTTKDWRTDDDWMLTSPLQELRSAST